MQIHNFYIKIPDPIKNLSEQINEFNEFAGYKIHILKSVAFLYSTVKYLKKYLISFVIPSNNKIFWNIFNQGSKRPVQWKLMILMQEIKDNIHNWEDTPCSWKRRINIVKISILSLDSVWSLLRFQWYFPKKYKYQS